jgi:hypothetical protein
MEFITILLSSLLTILTPAGLILEKTAENNLRSQFSQVQQLKVRVDNAPSHQLLQGKVEKVRIAGRGLQLKRQNIRIALLELETDPIAFDAGSLGSRLPQLKRPLQGGMRLIFNQDDVNNALKSPKVLEKLQNFNLNFSGYRRTSARNTYKLLNPNVIFLPQNRLKIQVEIQEEGIAENLWVEVETGLKVIKGKEFQLVDPVVFLNNERVPPKFLNLFVKNINQRLNITNLEGGGLLTRILKFEIRQSNLEITGFFRLGSSSKFSDSK